MVSRFPNELRRVEHWLTFSRFWWLFDASHQTPIAIIKRVLPVLKGENKPIYSRKNDVGDHVVIYNTKWLALRGEAWRFRHYYSHSGYPGGMKFTPAWKLHETDPTAKDVPESILQNISGQLRQILPIPKGLQDYTEQEKAEFPVIWQKPVDYCEDL